MYFKGFQLNFFVGYPCSFSTFRYLIVTVQFIENIVDLLIVSFMIFFKTDLETQGNKMP